MECHSAVDFLLVSSCKLCKFIRKVYLPVFNWNNIYYHIVKHVLHMGGHCSWVSVCVSVGVCRTYGPGEEAVCQSAGVGLYWPVASPRGQQVKQGVGRVWGVSCDGLGSPEAAGCGDVIQAVVCYLISYILLITVSYHPHMQDVVKDKMGGRRRSCSVFSVSHESHHHIHRGHMNHDMQ